jgi:hypothetical protein
VYWLTTITNPLSSSKFIPPAPADNQACLQNVPFDTAILRLRLNHSPLSKRRAKPRINLQPSSLLILQRLVQHLQAC